MKYAEASKKTDNRSIKKGEELLKYAEDIHNCKFSKEFKQELIKGTYKHYDIPKYKIIDSLVKEWKVWMPYVSIDSYSRFIEEGLKSLIKIKATATFHSPNLKGYIGNKATVIRKLPTVLATSITRNGVVCIDGNPIK